MDGTCFYVCRREFYDFVKFCAKWQKLLGKVVEMKISGMRSIFEEDGFSEKGGFLSVVGEVVSFLDKLRF